MKARWWVIAVLFPLSAWSQSAKECPCLQGLLSAGIIGGESAAKPLLQAGAGYRFGPHYAGLGAGFDHYFLRSIPIYAESRYEPKSTGGGFLYGQLGYNIPYNNHLDVNFIPFITENHFRGGFFMDAGIGYWIPINNTNRVGISAGYSRKDLSNHQVMHQCVIAPCTTNTSDFRYSLGRMLARLSWSFGRQR